jgi:NAD+ synthase (glutamine-hydrolysing)
VIDEMDKTDLINSPHIGMSLNGVEIFTNSSASHHQLRKLQTRVRHITDATLKVSKECM